MPIETASENNLVSLYHNTHENPEINQQGLQSQRQTLLGTASQTTTSKAEL